MKTELEASQSDNRPRRWHYVYKIIDPATDLFYIGSRTSRVQPQDDLWIKYFTSSKRVKSLIEEFGVESFEPEILSVHSTGIDAYWAEQALIKSSIKDYGCLNNHYIDPENGGQAFNMSGVSRKLTEAQKKAIGNFHRGLKKGPQSEEHKKKISEAQKGKPRKKLTEEHKQRIREWCNERWSNPDARIKQADVMRKVNNNKRKSNDTN